MEEYAEAYVNNSSEPKLKEKIEPLNCVNAAYTPS